MKIARPAIAAALLLALAACAGRAIRQAPPSALPTARQLDALSQRSRVLAARPQWAFRGRIALSNGRQGGSGRIDWQQDGGRYAVSLSAPITRQSWRLSSDGQTARLDGLAGGPRAGGDAGALLREATGWDIPVAALSAWVRGTPAPGLAAADLQFDARGNLATLRQGGWTIFFAEWQPQAALGVDLPGRVEASQGQARVRLVIDAWQDGPDAP